MAHPEQRCFIETVAACLGGDFRGLDVLEVGSYDNTGTIRPAFAGSAYVGVDLVEGPGVDVVGEGSALDFPDSTFAVTLSSECFEHNPYWAETIANMHRMTRPGGVMIFSCATTGRFEHGTARTSPMSPGSQQLGWDYYRNLSEADIRAALALDELFADYRFLTHRISCDLYFIGLKPGAPPIFPFDSRAIVGRCKQALAALQRDLAAQRRADPARHPPFARMMGAVGRLPLLAAARLLPDRTYQDFVIAYERKLDTLKAPVRRFL